jgi:hypothetical protein
MVAITLVALATIYGGLGFLIGLWYAGALGF